MQYHVAKNGEKSGPFDKEEVYRRLVAGELSGTDLGWHEGLSEWEPLAKLIPPPQAPPILASSGVFAPAAVPGHALASPSKTSGMAIASMVCGILGLLLWLPCIPAIILGHLGLSAIKKSAGALTGKGMAITGLVTGYLMIAIIPIIAAIAIPAFSIIQQSAARVQTVNNARQLVIGMKQYAVDHDGKYPPTLEALFDEQILTDRKLLEFPSRMNVPGQGWDYRGAGLIDTSEGKFILLITKKADKTQKKVIAYNTGAVEVAKE